MGKPTGYLVEVQGVGYVPLCLTTGNRDPRLYAAYQTEDGPGKIEFPQFVDNAQDLQDMGYAKIKAKGAKAENSRKGNSRKAPPKKPENSPEIPEQKPAEKPKKKGGLHELLGG